MVFDILILTFAVLVLLACERLGYQRWVRPHEPGLSWQAKALMGLVILTLAGGFIGAFTWWADVPGSFAWDPPPLASRMLASAGWSFALLSFATVVHPTQHRLRLYLWMLGVYMWPLTAAILLFHLDRFDFQAPITYAFFAVVVILNGGPIWFLARQPEVAPDGEVEEAALLVLCVPARGRRRARGRGLALFFFVHDALPIEAQDFPEALQAHQQLALVIW